MSIKNVWILSLSKCDIFIDFVKVSNNYPNDKLRMIFKRYTNHNNSFEIRNKKHSIFKMYVFKVKEVFL